MASVTLAGVLLLANVGSNLDVDVISNIQHDAYNSGVSGPPAGHQRATSEQPVACARHHAPNPLLQVPSFSSPQNIGIRRRRAGGIGAGGLARLRAA